MGSSPKKISGWNVVAVLLINNKEMHYKELAEKVCQTGLTDLGKDGETPAQTLNSSLKKKKDVFNRFGERTGIYSLNYQGNKEQFVIEKIGGIEKYDKICKMLN